MLWKDHFLLQQHNVISIVKSHLILTIIAKITWILVADIDWIWFPSAIVTANYQQRIIVLLLWVTAGDNDLRTLLCAVVGIDIAIYGRGRRTTVSCIIIIMHEI